MNPLRTPLGPPPDPLRTPSCTIMSSIASLKLTTFVFAFPFPGNVLSCDLHDEKVSSGKRHAICPA